MSETTTTAQNTSVQRRTETVPIFQGDDAAAIAAALADVNRATAMEAVGARRLNEVSPAQEAAEHYDEVVAEALPRAVTAMVRALGRKQYRQLRAEHPPREDDEGDEEAGYNREALHDALLEYYDPETGETTVIAPTFGSKQTLVAWLDDLSDGNFVQLAMAAVRVNEGGSPSPKASLASQIGRMFNAISPQPDTSGSPSPTSTRLTP